MTLPFTIKQGVRVDRVGPLGPYIFLIVGEITNIMVKQVSADKVFRGVIMPSGKREQNPKP